MRAPRGNKETKLPSGTRGKSLEDTNRQFFPDTCEISTTIETGGGIGRESHQRGGRRTSRHGRNDGDL